MLAYLPYVPVELPDIFRAAQQDRDDAAARSDLTMAGIALSYDVLFGRTGLLSFGHALFVAAGSYFLAIAMTRWDCRFVAALALAARRARAGLWSARSRCGSAGSPLRW